MNFEKSSLQPTMSPCLTETEMPSWYAVYTYPRQEKVVTRNLEQRNTEYFLPLYRSVRRWKDRNKELELVLFPGYVFVHVRREDRLRVLQTPGVVRIVTFNNQPATLPNAEIEALRHGLEEGIYAEPHPYLKVGRKARVLRGPLAGLEGILLRKKDRLRFVISLDVLMRSVAVELDAADLRPAT